MTDVPSDLRGVDMQALVQRLIGEIAGLREDLVKQTGARVRTTRITALVVVVLFAAFTATAMYQSSQVKQSTCEALNTSNEVLRSLFLPRIEFVPSPVPADASPEEVAALKAADAKRKVATEEFTADLKIKTAPQKC